MRKRILAAAPAYQKMDYCFLDFIKHLKEIDYDNFDILIVDNSKTKGFLRKINKIPNIKVVYDDTKEEKNMLRLISSRNKIIDYAIRKKYDYLLMMDSDVMATPNLLRQLLSHKKDVVSGLYFNIFRVDEKNQVRPVCYKEIEEDIYQEMKRKKMIPHFIKSREGFRRNITNEEIQAGKLLEVLYPSAGCLLLSKKAFSSGARYGLFQDTHGLHTSDDIYFFKELRKKEFQLYCNPTLICRHDTSSKFEKDGSHPMFK